MTREDEILALHRDADGWGLLVSPDCPDCLRRHVARYRCVVCKEIVEVPGVMRWQWQGRGHWHDPDDRHALQAWMDAHRAEHGERTVFVPVREETP